MSQRLVLLADIARMTIALAPDRIARLAIDGVDGAGKTTFADELATVITDLGRPVIRASVDGFHNPRDIRYARGRQSPVGFFEDSYDYTSLKRLLLDPLSPGGSGRYCVAAFDHRSNATVPRVEREAPPNAVLLLDGIFLHRDELRDYWDASLFLQVDFSVSVGRSAIRDGASPDPSAVSNRRYVEGQEIYLCRCAPEHRASMVIDNNELSAPFVVGSSASNAEP